MDGQVDPATTCGAGELTASTGVVWQVIIHIVFVPAAAVRGRCPRPLNDGAEQLIEYAIRIASIKSARERNAEAPGSDLDVDGRAPTRSPSAYAIMPCASIRMVRSGREMSTSSRVCAPENTFGNNRNSRSRPTGPHREQVEDAVVHPGVGNDSFPLRGTVVRDRDAETRPPTRGAVDGQLVPAGVSVSEFAKQARGCIGSFPAVGAMEFARSLTRASKPAETIPPKRVSVPPSRRTGPRRGRAAALRAQRGTSMASQCVGRDAESARRVVAGAGRHDAEWDPGVAGPLPPRLTMPSPPTTTRASAAARALRLPHRSNPDSVRRAPSRRTRPRECLDDAGAASRFVPERRFGVDGNDDPRAGARHWSAIMVCRVPADCGVRLTDAPGGGISSE